MDIVKKIAQDSRFRKTQITVATDNLSRESIPGEKEKVVLEPKSFKNLVKGPAPLAKTHANHLSGTTPVHDFDVRVNKQTLEMGLNNNSIDAEEQHAKIAEAATNISKNLAMFRALSNQNRTVLDR